jgi:hypothetical protein
MKRFVTTVPILVDRECVDRIWLFVVVVSVHLLINSNSKVSLIRGDDRPDIFPVFVVSIFLARENQINVRWSTFLDETGESRIVSDVPWWWIIVAVRS